VGPSEAFTTTARFLTAERNASAGYQVVVASPEGVAVPTGTGLAFAADPLPDPETIDTVVLPGGAGVEQASADEDLMAWVSSACSSARRVMTVCTGVVLAAETGLLDGLHATTHWASADRLAQRYPDIRFDANRMFVRSSERIWTAAGVSAGIDLALAVVEADHGTEVARAVAHWLVLHLRRPGGQGQFAQSSWTARARRAAIRAVQESIEAEPAARHTIPALASQAAMSTRHFTRVFTDELGEPPGTYVERTRVDAARRQLEETEDTMQTIATRCGFGTPESMRRNFLRHVGISPAAYRKAFI
jgi:transcriptional regulator GlxA family with amidase domain